MTIEQFLLALAKTPRKWYLDGTRLRIPSIAVTTEPCEDGELCPINALRGRDGDALLNGLELGLTAQIAGVIIAGADFGFGSFRDKLLLACGVSNVRTR